MSESISRPLFNRRARRTRRVVLASVLTAFGAVAVSCAAPPMRASAPAASVANVADDANFRAFLTEFEADTERFINGDAVTWKQNASQSDDATIMGGWGAYERGWDEVGPRYDWAAARFQESGAQLEVEYLSTGVSGDLAYTVAIERSQALIVDQDKPAPVVLRVTHLFHKEDGEWKLVHRHADPLMQKTAPDAVLQK